MERTLDDAFNDMDTAFFNLESFLGMGPDLQMCPESQVTIETFSDVAKGLVDNLQNKYRNLQGVANGLNQATAGA